jgi:hypothetical protein
MMESKLDDLLKQLDVTKCVNNKLLEAYDASHEEYTLQIAMIKELT